MQKQKKFITMIFSKYETVWGGKRDFRGEMLN